MIAIKIVECSCQIQKFPQFIVESEKGSACDVEKDFIPNNLCSMSAVLPV